MKNQLTCVRCNLEKPVGDFLKKSSTYRKPTCFECRKAADFNRRNKPGYKEKHFKANELWELKNPGQKTAYMRKLRATNLEYVERSREQVIEYNEKHRKERLAYQKKRQANNQALINAYKNKPCMDCGVEYPTYVLDFDHVRGEKSFNISGAKSNRTPKAIIAEIEKCDLVCSNCHRVRTQSRIDKA